jgi:hypothetical protein
VRPGLCPHLPPYLWGAHHRGTVTASGVYMQGSNSSFGCPANLIDGVFNYKPVAASGASAGVCFPHNDCVPSGYFDIKLTNPASIQTVLVINREDGFN